MTRPVHAPWHALATFLTLAAALDVAPRTARAVDGSRAVPSPMSGFAHNHSFDGRLYIIGRWDEGWEARIFRPDGVRERDGFVDLSRAFSPPVLIQPPEHRELALAICEPDSERAPYRCNASGTADPEGTFACYDVWVIDSEQGAPIAFMRRRRLFLQVRDPDGPDASVESFEWRSGIEPLEPEMRGLEPTVTRDGRLLVYQGVRENTGRIDTIVYSTNEEPCAATGWSTPRDLTRMHEDPELRERYPLAAEPLRSPDGTIYDDRIHGAYPWLFADGEALLMTSVNLPCRDEEGPEGCGLRRNGLSVIGYPTNWSLALVDGGVNPSRVDSQRLFFSTPGRAAFEQLPVTHGADVWPVFGSTTASYSEVVFDDGIDGRYAGVWHMNELVTPAGELDATQTPDTSGYFHTGKLLPGARLPEENNGVIGKAVELDGRGGSIEVAHGVSLEPVNNLTLELFVQAEVQTHCEVAGERLLVGKGALDEGTYALTLTNADSVTGRVRTTGGVREVHAPAAVEPGQWIHLALTYEGASGELALFVGGSERAREVDAPAPLEGAGGPLRFGGALRTDGSDGTADCTLAGAIDEVKLSNVVRYGTGRPPPRGLEESTRTSDPASGCRLASRGSPGQAWWIVLALLALRRRRTIR